MLARSGAAKSLGVSLSAGADPQRLNSRKSLPAVPPTVPAFLAEEYTILELRLGAAEIVQLSREGLLRFNRTAPPHWSLQGSLSLQGRDLVLHKVALQLLHLSADHNLANLRRKVDAALASKQRREVHPAPALPAVRRPLCKEPQCQCVRLRALRASPAHQGLI